MLGPNALRRSASVFAPRGRSERARAPATPVSYPEPLAYFTLPASASAGTVLTPTFSRDAGDDVRVYVRNAATAATTGGFGRNYFTLDGSTSLSPLQLYKDPQTDWFDLTAGVTVALLVAVTAEPTGGGRHVLCDFGGPSSDRVITQGNASAYNLIKNSAGEEGFSYGLTQHLVCSALWRDDTTVVGRHRRFLSIDGAAFEEDAPIDDAGYDPVFYYIGSEKDGGSPPVGSRLIGTIGDIAVFEGVLTAPELAALWAQVQTGEAIA